MKAWLRQHLPWFFPTFEEGLRVPPIFGPLCLILLAAVPISVAYSFWRSEPIYALWVGLITLVYAQAETRMSLSYRRGMLRGRQFGYTDGVTCMVLAWAGHETTPGDWLDLHPELQQAVADRATFLTREGYPPSS